MRTAPSSGATCRCSRSFRTGRSTHRGWRARRSWNGPASSSGATIRDRSSTMKKPAAPRSHASRSSSRWADARRERMRRPGRTPNGHSGEGRDPVVAAAEGSGFIGRKEQHPPHPPRRRLRAARDVAQRHEDERRWARLRGTGHRQAGCRGLERRCWLSRSSSSSSWYGLPRYASTPRSAAWRRCFSAVRDVIMMIGMCR